VSQIERFDNLKQVVKLAQPAFEELAAIHGAVNYKKEASFALQVLTDNTYLAQIAMSNQDSLKTAILNVAAIGLSLNPIQKLAYLVPRKNKVCLDIAYRGFVQLATDIGAIKWAMAEVVYSKDTYEYQGMGREPIHKFNPFTKDRGEIVGAYCLAKTHADEFILTQMSADEILAIRDRSTAWQAYQKDKSKLCPWNTDESEMIKKTVIRRAYKSWSLTDTRVDRLDKAVDVSNDVDEMTTNTPALLTQNNQEREEKFKEIRDALAELGRQEDKYLEHLIRVNRRDLKKLEDMTEIELNQAVTMMKKLVADFKKKKEEENEKFE
jgi:recombination protein RecT